MFSPVVAIYIYCIYFFVSCSSFFCNHVEQLHSHFLINEHVGSFRQAILKLERELNLMKFH